MSTGLSVEERITRSQVRVLKKFPFFGTLLLKLRVEEDENIKTMATDGRRLIYSPSFVDKLTEEELNWVVVHETMHPALGHIWRRKDRYPDLWNVACDYEIHSFMHQYIDETHEHGFMTMIKGGLYDTKYDNLSADKIYEMLVDKYEQNKEAMQGLIDQLLDNHGVWGEGNGDGDGDGDDGDGEGGDGGDKDGDGKDSTLSKDYLRKEWEGALVQAAQIASAKMAGGAPGCMDRIVKRITKSQKDWRELLAECIVPIADDYGFTPPDRRMQEFDFFMPDFSETTDTLGKVVFWIDTSGSMGEKEITAIYGEIVGCIEQFGGKLEGYIGCFDYDIHNFQKMESVDDIRNYIPKGGGGTNFKIPFKFLQEKDEVLDGLQAVVMLTDGYESFEGIPDLGCSVVWLITNEEVEPPFGVHATIDPNKI